MADPKQPVPAPPGPDAQNVHPKDVRRLYGVSEKTLKRRADEGHPVGRMKIGRRTVYHRPTLDAYMAGRAAGPIGGAA